MILYDVLGDVLDAVLGGLLGGLHADAFLFMDCLLIDQCRIYDWDGLGWNFQTNDLFNFLNLNVLCFLRFNFLNY